MAPNKATIDHATRGPASKTGTNYVISTVTPLTLTQMETIKAAVFDLDGTLIRSQHNYPEMTRRIREILKAEGVPEETLNQPRLVWGTTRGGPERLLEAGVPRKRLGAVKALINKAINEVEMSSLGTVEPMPGVRDMLFEVRKRGLKIGVATRAHGEYAMKSAEKVGISAFIDSMLARDEVEYPKPDPRHLLQVIDNLGVSPENTVYIGDTTTDLTTASAAGVAFIGFRNSDEWARRLKEAGCHNMISDLRELLKIIKERTDVPS